MTLHEKLIGRLLDALGHSSLLRTVAVGASFVMVIRVTGAGLAFLSQILLARWMGAFEFGVFVYAWVWVTILAILAPIGMDVAAVRFVPEYEAKKKWRRLRGFIRFSQLFVVLTCLLIAGGGFLLIRGLSGTIGAHHLLSLTVAMGAIPLMALLKLHQDLSRSFGWAVLAFAPEQLLRPLCLMAAVGVFFFAGFGASSVAALSIAIGAGLVALAAQVVVFERRLARTVPRGRPFYHRLAWLRVSSPLFLIGGFYLILYYTDLVMLGAFLPPDKVGIYSAALRIAWVLDFLPVAIAAMAVPKMSALYAQKKMDELQSLISNTIHWGFWPTVFLAVVFLLLGQFVLGLFGAAFVAGYQALLILLVAHIIIVTTGAVGDLLMVTGQQVAGAFALAFVAGTNIVFNFVLIPIYGISGAATATALSMALSSICLYVIARRRIGINAVLFARTRPEA